MKKNVTLKDVAKLAGVSTAAASKALRGEKDIGPETRARVEKIAESLGYCTNNLAIYLRNGSIKALGVVMPDSFNPYNALVLQGVEEKAKELGYNVIIGNTNCDRALERDLLKSFVSMKVSGILAIPSWLENYKTIPVPLIIMSRFPYMEPYASKAHAILRPDVHGYELLQGRGTVRGPLLGGCIDVFMMAAGTAVWPAPERWRRALLFLETSEDKPSPTFVTWALRNLAAQGVLDAVSGILFGKPQDEAYYEEYKQALRQVVAEEAGRSELPILYNLNFGHAAPIGVLPIGVPAELDCEKKTLTLLESATKSE